ncbi:MAG: DUF1264 domain-containing protein [Burkholderiales bacterium]|nr:MAG: DUF1264 domain-containing protein [Burkholderiales bacterium]
MTFNAPLAVRAPPRFATPHRAAADPARGRPRVATASLLLIAALAALSGCDLGAPKVGATVPPDSLIAPVAGHPQPRAPVDAFVAHLDGFQFRNGDLGSQQRVQHYCASLGDEVMQCALFDGTGAQARLTGVEYVISERLFADLPDDEKAYWHSQVHQVKAGTLVAPGLPEEVEHALASRLVRTYAKAWRLWPDGDGPVPRGVPQLMMGFTGDGQLDPVLLSERDREIGVASAEKKRQRADIPATRPADGADAWQQGRVAQVQGAVGSGGAR